MGVQNTMKPRLRLSHLCYLDPEVSDAEPRKAAHSAGYRFIGDSL